MKYQHIYIHFECSSICGMCLQALHTQSYFMSQFCEVLVIAVSLQLAERFAIVWRKIKRLADIKVIGIDVFFNRHHYFCISSDKR